MQKTVAGFFLTACLIGIAPAMAAGYIIDKKGQHAFISFKASHLGYSYIVGRFNDFDGKFTYDAEAPEKSSVSVTINAASLDTNHAERDKHLRNGDFFDAGKYPVITFESTSFDGEDLQGVLHMRGVSKNISIEVEHIGAGKDPWGGYRSGFAGDTVLKASDFGMPDWVGDVEVELIIEGIRQ